ncbi:MAG: hypothetical protein JRJ58_17225 [Deltaproteobacteria bacterium]|nr:hypothetical protein [Deltaproteobacteria bacterium]
MRRTPAPDECFLTPRREHAAPVESLARRLAWSILLLCIAIASTPSLTRAAQPLRIAVAPFVGEGAQLQAAQTLTGRLARRPIERLIAPDPCVIQATFDPRAALVRQWAYNVAVDTVIVGRVRALQESRDGEGWRVETVLRSGHSGAELARQAIEVASRSDFDASIEQLAVAILEDLGFREGEASRTGPTRDPRSPEPAGLVASEASPDAEADPDADTKLGFASLDREKPIEIRADEAEILDRGEGRKLIFQRNVRVRQGDISLESDRLEAEYPKGQSQPDRLIARGSVRVEQGDRRAKCDRAEYDRLEERLICQGRAELIQGCDVVRGDSIEFDLVGGRAHVKGAASVVIRPVDEEEQACAVVEAPP